MEICHSSYNHTDGGAVQITQSNLDMVLASNEIVFINFYANWCRFSNMLMPIFDDAAVEVTKAGYDPGKVVMGKVDCDKEGAIATRFHISKYPTFKLFRNGLSAKKEYRGERSVEAFAEFIKKQLIDPVIVFSDLKELHDLSEDKRHIIGYMDKRDQPEYDVFRKVAASLKDECQFHVGFGEASQQMLDAGQSIVVFRTDKKTSVEPDETYHGSLLNFDELYAWVQQKCFSFVREITFENAEELTEEGLPFLILFHKPTDTESVKKYKEVIRRELESERKNINFLTADGIRFQHPMNQLGKSVSDLPLIALDSFLHMYLFPDYNDMEKPGKLKQFLQEKLGTQNSRNSKESSESSSADLITENNIESLLASNELVLILSYSDWYKNNYLRPIFDKAAEEITKHGFASGKVVLCKVNIDKAAAVKTKYGLTSYPLITYYRNGLSAKSYYKGKISVEAIVEFVKQQLTDPISTFTHLDELQQQHLCAGKGHVIAYLNNKHQPEYDVLRKVATSLRDECEFHVGFSDSAQKVYPPAGQLSMVLRATKGAPVEIDEIYHGSLLNFDDICSWVREKHFPHLLEISSENIRELRKDQWRRFVMLVYDSRTAQTSVKKYKDTIRKEFSSKKDVFNFYIADGTRYEELMLRLGKSTSDLPLIVIEFFKLYVGSIDFNDVIEKPGKLGELVSFGAKGYQYQEESIYLGHLIDDVNDEYYSFDLFD